MRVAYILDSFPNTSETFISDEIYSISTSEKVKCDIFSLGASKSTLVNARAKLVQEICSLTYCVQNSIIDDLINIATLIRFRPWHTLITLGRALFCKQQRWIARKALSIAKQVIQTKVTHVHAHYADQAAAVAMWTSRFTAIPYTFTTHGYDIFFSPPDNFPELAKGAKSIICVSIFNKNYIASQFGIDEQILKVIRCGIYTNDFHYDNTKPIPSNTTLKLLCVGRLVPEKGHRHLLNAVPILNANGIRVALLLVGSGPLRDELEALGKSLGISDQIKFAGAQTNEEVRHHLHDADIFVLPSISEGMPVAIMEAMASGLPVIATSVRGVPELVEDKVTGLLCPPADPDSISKAIQWALGNPIKIDRMRIAARNKIHQEFERDKCTSKLISIWKP